MEKVTMRMIYDIIWRRKIPIFFLSLVVGSAVFVVNYKYTPKKYKSTGSVIFNSKPALSTLFSMESVSQFVSSSMMQGADLNIKGILESRNISVRVYSEPQVLAAYQKLDAYKGKTPEQIAAMESVFMNVVVENKMLNLIFQGPTPDIAAKVTNSYLDELINFVNNERQNVNHEQIVYMEQELPKMEKKLRTLEELMRDYEIKDPTLMSSESDTELIKRYSTMNSEKEKVMIEMSQLNPGGSIAQTGKTIDQLNELMAKDPNIGLLRQTLDEATLELNLKSQVLDDTHPTIIALKQKVAEVQSQIKDAIAKYYVGKKIELDSINRILDSYNQNILTLPETKLQYGRLMRDRKIIETVYAIMRAEYEKSKIQEKSKDFTLTILDRGDVPTRKSYPPTVRNTLISTFAAFLVLTYLCIFFDTRKRRKSAAA